MAASRQKQHKDGCVCKTKERMQEGPIYIKKQKNIETEALHAKEVMKIFDKDGG